MYSKASYYSWQFHILIQLHIVHTMAHSCTHKYIHISSVLLTVSKSLILWLVLFWLTIGLSSSYTKQYRSIYHSLDFFLPICIWNATKNQLIMLFLHLLVLDQHSQVCSLSFLVPKIQKKWPYYSRHAKEQLSCWALSLILPTTRSNSWYNSIHNFSF